MPTIWCYMESCIYLKNNECMAAMVEIDDDGSCSTFDDYKETAEYQNVYYAAVKACDGKPARALKRGKKIVINGVTFFTDSPPSAADDQTYITHERSGLYCSTVERVKKCWADIVIRLSETQVVSELPLAEYDEKNRMYVYQKGGVTDV